MLVMLKRDIRIGTLFLSKGTAVWVDTREGIGFAEGSHFDIEREDYETLH